MERNLYLEIAGVIIKLNLFESTESIGIAKNFLITIKPYLKNFLIPPQKSYHFCLSFKYRNFFTTSVNLENKMHLIDFYQELGRKQIVSYYHISPQQLLVIIRELVYKQLKIEGGLIVHGSSAVDKKNNAQIFLGKSGAGKSTIVAMISPEYRTIADDIFIIKKEGSKYYIYQTPFIQKNTIDKYKTGKFLLEQIFFLHKGDEVSKLPVTEPDARFNKIASQILINNKHDNYLMSQVMELIFNIKNIYLLTFNLKNRHNLLKSLI